MIKTIIFDFDGVLVESVEIKTEAFRKLFQSEGKKHSEEIAEYHRQNTGVSRFDKFRYFYKNILFRELTEEIFAELCRKYSQLVVDEVVRAPYVAGALEFLENHAKDYACFVLSATPEKEIKEIIEKRKLQGFFRNIYGAPKEKPAAVKEIITGYKLFPAETVYIGDSLSDYKAADANSVNFIARVNNSDLFEKINCIKINDLTRLNEILSAADFSGYGDK